MNWWISVYYSSYDASVFTPKVVEPAIEKIGWMFPDPTEARTTEVLYEYPKPLGCSNPEVVYLLHEHVAVCHAGMAFDARLQPRTEKCVP